MHKRFLSFFGIFFLATSMLLPGCASKYGPQQTKVHYYPQCYRPVSDLRNDENEVGRSTALGAASGALLGAAIGGLASGNWKGALAGAAAGAATGAVAGNIYGKNQAAKRDARYVKAYRQQLGAEAASMNRATSAAKVAMQCYDGEFKRAAADYKAGKITKDEFRDRYAEIRSGLQETSYILKARYDSMSAKDREYEQALAPTPTPVVEEQPVSNSQPQRRRQRPTRRYTQQATTLLPQERDKWTQGREGMGATARDADNQISSNDKLIAQLTGDASKL